MSPRKKAKKVERDASPEISIYTAWCKRCGNCVAFCPLNVLESDEWGCPYVAHPEKCTRCHKCEMLCPDFAITVGDDKSHPRRDSKKAARECTPETGSASPQRSPERVVPEPPPEEEDGA